MRATTEIRSLTGLRGVAALYVVFYHYFPLDTVTSAFARCLDHGYLSVDLFFVLSGFVMTLTYGHFFERGPTMAGYLRFLGRRIARIYPIYIIATAAGFALVLIGVQQHYQPTAPLGVDLFLNALMVQSWGLAESFDSPAWSLSTEWAAYVLFPLLLVPAMFRKPLAAWICALVCAGVLAALCAFPPYAYNAYERLNISDHHWGIPVYRCLAEFVLGILAFRLSTTAFGKTLASSRWIAGALCVLTIGLAALPKSDLAIVLLFPLLVVALSSDAHVPGRILASPPLEFLGKLSYSLYLTHKLFFQLVNYLELRGHAAGLGHARIYAAAVCIALSFAIAYVAYRTVEVPGRRWLRDLFEGREAQAPRAVQGSAG